MILDLFSLRSFRGNGGKSDRGEMQMIGSLREIHNWTNEPQNIEQGMPNDEVTVAHKFLHQTLAFDALFDILVRQDKPDFSINLKRS
ncbi:MAG: hypothetical protein IIC50_07240 [Planctomycetes bacterium]|nr:hypothetical protein [Planctomycetota bacterium]